MIKTSLPVQHNATRTLRYWLFTVMQDDSCAGLLNIEYSRFTDPTVVGGLPTSLRVENGGFKNDLPVIRTGFTCENGGFQLFKSGILQAY
jgi:hypothetical protein